MSSWFVGFTNRSTAPLRLCCFPHGGGGTSSYARWIREVPPTIDLHALAMPGREHRSAEPPATDLGELAVTVAGALVAEADPRPFGFFGHSGGSLLALETARALRRAGGPAPCLLAVSASFAPRRDGDNTDLAQQLFGPDPEGTLLRARRVPDPVLKDFALLSQALAAMQADYVLYSKYHYPWEPPLDCPISTFCGAHDYLVRPGEMERWGAHTTAVLVPHVYPGDHFFLQHNLAAVVRDLSGDLSAAAGTGG